MTKKPSQNESPKVLVANRGEIASRVFRTCKDLGIKTVAVYSKPDGKLPFTRIADEAYLLEGTTSLETYLNAKQILAIAKKTKCTAIHPGYGFLSENASFSRACRDEGILFIGPDPEAIETMGDKIRSRQFAETKGVAIVPGQNNVTNLDDLKKAMVKIGFPLLLKCSAGGGGHGMRLVESEDKLESAFKMARAEGKKSFGDDTIYVERALTHPRHVEVQVFGSKQRKAAVALGTRDCSVQRRNQKVIEEAQAPNIPDSLRSAIESAAANLAQSMEYSGAGTVEFLVQDDDYFFLEMNTRLQVEHGVTEMVYGIDLVACQIFEALGWQEDLDSALANLNTQGHAIECRIYAEDPNNNFAPSAGKLLEVRFPAGPYVRVDQGVETGSEVSSHYDPMIAKIMTFGSDRKSAISRMLRALDEVVIIGVKHNVSFLADLLKTSAFEKAELSTRFIQENWHALQDQHETIDIATLAAASVAVNKLGQASVIPGKKLSFWQITPSGES